MIAKQGLLFVLNCEHYINPGPPTSLPRILLNVNRWLTSNKLKDLRFLLGFDSLLTFFCNFQLKVIRTLLALHHFKVKFVVVKVKLTIVWLFVFPSFFVYRFFTIVFPCFLFLFISAGFTFTVLVLSFYLCCGRVALRHLKITSLGDRTDAHGFLWSRHARIFVLLTTTF